MSGPFVREYDCPKLSTRCPCSGPAFLCLAQAMSTVWREDALVWRNDCLVSAKYPLAWQEHSLLHGKRIALLKMNVPLSDTSILLCLVTWLLAFGRRTSVSAASIPPCSAHLPPCLAPECGSMIAPRLLKRCPCFQAACPCLAHIYNIVWQKDTCVWRNDCFVCAKQSLAWHKQSLLCDQRTSLFEMSTPLPGTSILFCLAI